MGEGVQPGPGKDVKRSQGVGGVSWGGRAWEGCREHWDVGVEVG